MNTYKKMLMAAIVVAPGAVLAASQADAQAVAVADPQAAVANTKAFTAATTQIRTSFKAQLDQAAARQTAVQAEVDGLVRALDTNKDGQVSEAELAAAQAAKRPELASIQQKRTALQQEVGRLEAPAARAQQYVVEQISAKFPQALQSAVTKRGVTVLLRPEAAIYAQPTADLTAAITTELDTLVPSVGITPPANWQPGQQGQAGAAPAAAPAAPAATPAAPAKKTEKPR